MFTVTIKDQNGQIADSFSFDHGSYVIGRLDECDIVLPSGSVSREHARLFIEEDRCYIEDLDSANGVIVDGQRVVQTRDLGTASQIRVGEFYLYLEWERPTDSKKQDVMSTLFIDSGSEHHKLVRVNDSFAGEEFSLSEQQNTIGRTDDNFILLSDSSISRKHATIHRRADLYMIEDRGSSNGTRLNGKEVTDKEELAAGDHVEFGSVEFIFAEGDASVDPTQAGPAASSGSFSYGLVAGLAAAGLALGVVLVFGALQFVGDDGDPAVDPLDAEVQQLLDEGDNQLQTGNLEAASASFEEALDLMPEHERAREMYDRVDREREGTELLEEGRRLSEQGRHSEARATLLAIPEGTRASERARQTLSYVDGTIVHNLRSEANRLLRGGEDDELKTAYEKIVEAASIAPDDEELANMIDEIEQRLDDEDLEPPTVER